MFIRLTYFAIYRLSKRKNIYILQNQATKGPSVRYNERVFIKSAPKHNIVQKIYL